MTIALKIEKPGPFTTLQDIGRQRHRSSGVSVGGAMDRFALAAANRLVGNHPDAGCLEVVLSGSVLLAETHCLAAITGGDLTPTVNSRPVPNWTSICLERGDRLAFTARRHGARAYLAVAGGLDGERWLGSLSTYPLVGRGGISGRMLQAGDVVMLASEPPRPLVTGRHLPEMLRPAYPSSNSAEVAAILGPHFNRMPADSRKLFFSQEYEVGRDSDRMGYRLAGQNLEIKGPELLSFGLTFGSIQLPRSGQPILLMAEHQTAGGYPVIAVVVRADLPVAAQLLPGDKVRFRSANVTAAQARWFELMRGLQTIR